MHFEAEAARLRLDSFFISSITFLGIINTTLTRNSEAFS